ncbi:MAG TPA: hypothetical protein DCZ76_13175 [Treponema sp.]|nr:hypothetical protein [Treponema sp.]
MVDAYLQTQPSPDWKGAERVAVRQWRREPEPWKAGKNALRGILSRKFSGENLRDKMLRSLTGHGVPGTVEKAIRSKIL